MWYSFTADRTMPVTRHKLIASAIFALTLMAGSASFAEDQYELVLAEEFDGAELNRDIWQTTMAFIGRQGGRYHNDSYLSYSTDEDVQIEDGCLRLRAHRRPVLGDDPVGSFSFSQGLISTHERFSFTYGYVEIYARMPSGQGVWPTIWLMPVDTNAWPPEFDIAEYYASTNRLRFGLATGTMTEVRWDEISSEDRSASDGWHVYGLLWEPGRAVWLMDGEVKLEVRGERVPSIPMYLILNNGVSSRVGPSGEPGTDTVFPNFLEVEYIHIYQRPPSVLVSAPVLTADG